MSAEEVPLSFEEILVGSGESQGAVEVLRKAITAPKVDKDNDLLMLSNTAAPEVFAVLFAKAEWCDRRLLGRGEVRRRVGRNLLMLEVSRRGDDNRTKLVVAATEAMLRQEFEIKKSAGSALMGQ